MNGVDHLAGPPAVLPLPRLDDPRFADLLAYGREKDPRGDVVHAWIAGLAFGLQPLTPVAAWIGLVILAGYAVLRLHATWRCLPLLLRMPLMVAWIAMALWTLLAIIWSSDPEQGIDNAGALRVILLITASWPILDRWRPIVFGLAAGSAVQMVFQLLMYVGGMENDRWIFEAHGEHRGLGIGIGVFDAQYCREAGPWTMLGDGVGRMLHRRHGSRWQPHVTDGISDCDRVAASLERASRSLSTSEAHHARRAHPGFSWNVGIARGGAVQPSSETPLRHDLRVGEGAGRSGFQYKLRPSSLLVA